MVDAPFFGASDRHSKLLYRLALKAISNTPVARARIVSAIVYKGDIFAYGRNQMKSHPFQARFGKNADSIYLHAEINAIYQAVMFAGFKADVGNCLKDCTLYVCRVKNVETDCTSGLAKPCLGCQRAIAEFGIKNVIYTLDGNQYDLL